MAMVVEITTILKETDDLILSLPLHRYQTNSYSQKYFLKSRIFKDERKFSFQSSCLMPCTPKEKQRCSNIKLTALCKFNF